MKKSPLFFVLILLTLATCETYHLYSEKKKEMQIVNGKCENQRSTILETKSSEKLLIPIGSDVELETETNHQNIINLSFGLHPTF